MGFFKKLVNVFAGDEETEEEEREIITEEMSEDDEGAGAEAVYEDIKADEVKRAQRAVELKVIKLTAYDEGIMKVADHLLKKRTVVLNLEGAGRDAAKRILDFLSGVVYAIKGQLKAIANGTYIITPSNVDVSNDQVQMAQSAQPEGEGAESLSSEISEF